MKKILLLVAVIIIIILFSVLFTYIAVNRTESKSSDKATQRAQEKTQEKMINVPLLCQYPSLPTGCEATAAVMVLQYYGVNITPEAFASSWLEYSNSFYYLNNELYGPNPNEVFAGDPFSEYSYGCYALPIVKAINANSDDCTARIVKGTLKKLCDEYISHGKPILIWATMSMKESKAGRSWYLQDGSCFTWIAGEHCLVLTGYNEEYYFLNDPQSGAISAYPKAIVEKRYKELGSQAIYICRK